MTPPGEIISGRYRIIRPLATGGMSRIWLAADESSTVPGAPPVVIKQCTVPEGLASAQRDLVREWALPEAQAAARVRHPNLIRTLEVLPDEDGPWIVMEFLPSRSLQEIVEVSGALPAHQVATIGLAILAALGAARRAGLLHLDVKPGNVLITGDGRVVLTDFGPAVTPAAVDALTRAGVVLGSPKYIAPERLFDRLSAEQADLWSLGATLYHAVEGRPPYLRESTSAILRALADSPPDPPRRAGPLTPVLTGLLRRDPAERLTAAQVRLHLQRIARSSGPVPRRARPVLRRRLTAAAAVVTLLTTLTAVGASASSSRTPDAAAPLTSASAAPAPLPADFAWWNDPSGFRVALPRDWRPVLGPSDVVAFEGPRGEPSLRVSRWAGASPDSGAAVPSAASVSADSVAALLAEEQEVELSEYRRVRIEALSTPPGAIWEYTFQGTGDVAMRGLRRVIGVGDRAYVLEWRVDRAGWVAGLPQLSVILNTFTRPSP
ncbi:serine/threonine-protein kinase [Actinoplanes sp. NPDC051861]|uniref:serine/threonine-protein kinase n=1 Tax=Actinoplanes sp. NPDC051861 TaxID=3155170 RepID=UPI00341DDBA9